jgi:hypothetical protein
MVRGFRSVAVPANIVVSKIDATNLYFIKDFIERSNIRVACFSIEVFAERRSDSMLLSE